MCYLLILKIIIFHTLNHSPFTKYIFKNKKQKYRKQCHSVCSVCYKACKSGLCLALQCVNWNKSALRPLSPTSSSFSVAESRNQNYSKRHSAVDISSKNILLGNQRCFDRLFHNLHLHLQMLNLLMHCQTTSKWGKKRVIE